MPQFDSPLGTKKFAGKPLQEFEVPDESQPPQFNVDEVIRRQNMQPLDQDAIRAFQAKLEQDPAQIEREMQAAKEARRTGKERLNDGAKRRIEMLIGMTQSTREANIEGTAYVLRTLKSNEMRESIMAAAEYDNTVQFPFEIRKQLLARSLKQVGGIDVEQFVGSNSFDIRLQFVDELPDALTSRLYDEYLQLSNEAKTRYSIKTPEEAKEVVEELKK